MSKEIFVESFARVPDYDISDIDLETAIMFVREYFIENGKVGSIKHIADIEDLLLKLDSKYPGIIAEVAAEFGFDTESEII